MDQRALNFVLIALRADIFFRKMGVIGRSYSFHRAMFGLFGDTDSDITSGRAIGVEVNVEADSMFWPRSHNTVERLALYSFDAEDTGAFLSELLRCFVLGEC